MAYLLWQLLTESARTFPTRPAVSARGATITYQELDAQSTRLASSLASAGIGPGARVGLYMPKSSRSVVAMLGVLKAGAAYVPIDPGAPTRRAAYILSNCRVSALIGTSAKIAAIAEHLDAWMPVRTIILTDDEDTGALGRRAAVQPWDETQRRGDGFVPAPILETDPAYLLYTSGSTGHPKGVTLSHRHALTFVEWGINAFDVRSEDRLSNHAPLHFDLSVFDIYAALGTGACVALVPDGVAPFPQELARWIDEERISVWYSVPSALVRLLLHGTLERYRYPALRTILFAGEVFPVKYLRELMAALPHVEFYNLYGPTETNVCTFYRVPVLPSEQTAEIPIGRACANTAVFAVDEMGKQVPEGEVGELLVRGPTVMLGYWGLPDKTAAALVRNPVQTSYHEWAYRTGDFVRLGGDGNYVFCGRKDDMVKSRGYRIELGEIEHVLNQHEDVREAVVLALADQEIGARLKAVVVPHGVRMIGETQLQAFCLERLPKYMVPELFEFRDELPRTSTGKTDRMALRGETAGERGSR